MTSYDRHLRDIKIEILHEGATILNLNLVKHTPFRKGKMRESAHATVNESRGEVVIGYDEGIAPHAKFVLKGTPAHIIRPKRAGGVLRFVKGGKVIFAKYVNHPGTKEQGTRIFSATLRDSQGPIENMLNTYGEKLAVRIGNEIEQQLGRIVLG